MWAHNLGPNSHTRILPNSRAAKREQSMRQPGWSRKEVFTSLYHCRARTIWKTTGEICASPFNTASLLMGQESIHRGRNLDMREILNFLHYLPPTPIWNTGVKNKY